MCQHDPKHLPFQRNDQYGNMGKKPQPLAERLRLALLSVTVLPIKIVSAASCISGFYLVCRASELLPLDLKRKVTTAFGKTFCRLCLLSIGFGRIKWVKVKKAAWDMHKSDRPAVGIVSNHCSHVDILVHMARAFPALSHGVGPRKYPSLASSRESHLLI